MVSICLKPGVCVFKPILTFTLPGTVFRCAQCLQMSPGQLWQRLFHAGALPWGTGCDSTWRVLGKKKSTGLACNSILSRLSTSELRSSNLGRSGSRLLIPTIALSGHPMRDLPTEVNMGYTGGGPSPLCGVLRVPRAGLQEDEAAAGRTKTGSGGQWLSNKIICIYVVIIYNDKQIYIIYIYTMIIIIMI